MKKEHKNRLILLVILALLFFAYRSYLKRNPAEKDVSEDKEIIDKVEDIVTHSPLEPKSEYEGNSLANGDSPFAPIYGNGVYRDTDHSLLIKNQGSTDVVVFLVSLDNNRILRNEYVRAKSTFNMTKIPNSTCYVKYYYGENWNPTRKTKNIVTGGFDNNEQFIVSDNLNDIFTFEVEVRGNYIYSNQYEITLETIISEGNAMSRENISASDFFDTMED